MAIGPTKPPAIYQQDSTSPSGFATYAPADFAWRHKHGGSSAWPGLSKPYPAPLKVIDGKLELYIGALATPDTVTVSFFRHVGAASRFPGRVDRYDLRKGDLHSAIKRVGRRRQFIFTKPRWRGCIMRLTISYSNNDQNKPSIARYFFRIVS